MDVKYKILDINCLIFCFIWLIQEFHNYELNETLNLFKNLLTMNIY